MGYGVINMWKIVSQLYLRILSDPREVVDTLEPVSGVGKIGRG